MKRTRFEVEPPINDSGSVWKKQKIHNSFCNQEYHDNFCNIETCGDCNNVMMASKANHVHCLNDILRQCEIAEDTINCARNALFYAIGQGYVDCVKSLLDFNSNGLNLIGDSGIAPLHMSAGAGHVEIMRELINRGANVNLKLETDKLNALHISASFGAKDCLKLLLDNGLDPLEQTSDSSMNSLHFAAYHGHISCINLLIEYGCELNSISYKTKRSVLHYALCQRKFDCFYMLVKNGADLTLLDKNGHSALLCIPLELPSLQFKFIEYFSLIERKKWFIYALIDVEKDAFRFTIDRINTILSVFDDIIEFNSEIDNNCIFERIPIIEFSFDNEIGKGTGVMREWFSQFEKDIITNSQFEKTNNNDSYYFKKNITIHEKQKQKQTEEEIKFISIIGFIFAIAFIYNNVAPIELPNHMYKLIIDEDITLSDLKYIDNEYYENKIVYLQNCSENELNDLELTFTEMEIINGKLVDIELKENGKNITVTKESLDEYLHLVCNHKLFWGREDSINEFLSSFHHIIPKELIKPLFTSNEIKNILVGEREISIIDWRLNTKYENCSLSTPEIQWFWDIINHFSDIKKKLLISFCSGSKYLPFGGFSKLNDDFPFTIDYQKDLPEGTLPTSRTCFNTLILPKYKSKNSFKEKIKLVLKEQSAGANFSFV